MFTRLTESQIAKKIGFIRAYTQAGNAAEGSKLDANANVSSKNIATMQAEINKDVNIQINRALLAEKISELFGEELSREYIRQLEDHEIYTHDESSLSPYCASISLYTFLLEGLTKMGGESKAPKHMNSFCGSFVNLVFAISSQFAGAVATVEFLMYFDYFAKKEYGENYLETHAEDVQNHLQHVVYAINQPAAARGYQSIFWNLSLFDKPYFESMFGTFVFPDMTVPSYESLSKLQEYFMTWFNNERKKSILTFPVVTAAMLSDGNEPVDKEFADMLAQQLADGNSFFIYMSESVDSLSSCCFGGEQSVLVKDSTNGVMLLPIKEYAESKTDTRKNMTVYHDGSWCSAKTVKVKLGGKKMYKVTTKNNKELIVTEDHIHATERGDVRTDALTTDDYLLFSGGILDHFSGQKPEDFSYEDGLLIGAYLGDGSMEYTPNKTSARITLSMNKEKVDSLRGILTDWNIKCCENNNVSCTLNDLNTANMIKRFVTGDKCNTKDLSMDVFAQSREFRKGIIDGWYITDGGNSNRIYTTSEDLVKSAEALFTSLGIQTVVNVSDRTDEVVVIREEEYTRNFPLYCIRWYGNSNKRTNAGVYKKKNSQIFFGIKSIEPVDYNDEYVYCFEMNNEDEPYFTLPNGVITHNCRLRNELQDNTFSYSLGAGGVSTGSINVITVNLNRLVQDNRCLKAEIEKIQKYQVAYRHLMEEYLKAGLLTVYDAGFINLNKQFLTIGINGMVEAAESQGIPAKNTEEYKEFVSKHLKVIYETNKEGKKKYGYMFNTEFVPAENLGVKNAKWDRLDDYLVSRECYNSYFFPVEDEDISMLDKFILHGKDNVKYLDGGSALHLNLEQALTKEGFKRLFEIAAKTGCNYWCTNVAITCCEDCGAIDKKTLQECPTCGSKNVSWATRVIGYLKKIKDWSKERQSEHIQRYYH